jgi:hypothetical protein
MSVILTFYRNFVWLVIFITVLGCYLMFSAGSWTFIVVTFWMKIITNITLALFIHIFHPSQYYFFNNLGFGVLQLYVFTFILDMLIWFILSVLTINVFL